jgi:hypothetical protein
LFPHIVSAGGPGVFRGLRSLSVDVHHSPHASHILSCLLLPNLDSLELGSVSDGRGDAWVTSGVSAALRTAQRTSSVSKLYLPGACLSGTALADVLCVPSDLKEFGYHRAGAWVVWHQEDWDALAGALSSQTGLESLEWVEQCPSPDDAPGTIGSALAALDALKKVHIPWRALIRPGDPIEDEDGTGGLGAVLPSSIERLVLRNDAGRDISRRAARIRALLPHCSSLKTLHIDVERRSGEEREVADLKRECGAKGVELGTAGLSSWDWAFRPPSEVKMDSRSYYC